MKKLLQALVGRKFFVCLLLLLQVVFIVWVVFYTGSAVVSSLLYVLSLFIVVYVVNRRDKPAYKIAWIILMLTIPLFGGLLYLVLNWQSKSGSFRKYALRTDAEAKSYLPVDENVIEEFKVVNGEHTPQVNYLTKFAKFPMYKNSATEYFSPGEDFFPVFIEALKKAERYIFLEFFIIDSGFVWEETFKVLSEKAAAGVEIRLMYDDMGCMSLLPPDFEEKLKESGIKYTVFNPFRPLWSSIQNNRDHRKIVVIDGRIAFTGGVNLADEYINSKKRFGYWKDCCALVRGDAVKSYTVMFLHLWTSANMIYENFSKYLYNTPPGTYNDGYFLPYSDAPTDDENVCEHVYMQIINNAKRYVYIETPYFIIDDSMLSAFILAAKSGVDIRIITPSVPDKKFVHMTTRSYYHTLIAAGVRVYEYTPGFIHSKIVISDDDTATIGTANFDFRSLYLHYECGELIFNSSTVGVMKRDFLKTLAQCREITKEDTKRNVFVRLGQSILRIIAPLL